MPKGYCEKCRGLSRRSYDENRPSASKRGYGRRHRKQREIQLSKQPVCEECLKEGLVTAACIADHIIPISQGGDPDTPDNKQSLCESCHNRKTARESGFAKTAGVLRPSVTLVCGPPGSGKSSFVRKLHRWGDLVVDLDDLCVALSGLPMYDKPREIMPFVWDARDAVLRRLERPSEVRRAWVIMMGARPSDRAKIRVRLQAEVVILKPSMTECVRRIRADSRRADRWRHWDALVRRWWKDFEPAEGERVITDAVLQGSR